ncbi:hypothetical protein BIV03_10305 [Curtobacterium sp. MCBA15_016]|uniref:hypothetical protein n=1 Tax=Curtobacterium sp. MCBA15_016 TaxID=1898740 RepID=UPI0008DCF81C|nr:hypothetical protein [Curtobacterium sp. MCBA15_016]OII24212.1 hypothetical protein BIV03_10305 [Curtobacterium sp. MCBA15_016]
MTDTAARAASRWALAEERARLVLDAQPPRRLPIATLTVAFAAAVLALIAAALVFAPDSDGRWVAATVGVGVGFAVVILDSSRTFRSSRHPERLPVTRSLSGRERHAVDRAIRGRVDAPDERLDVVRATAVQSSSGRALLSTGGGLVLLTSVAVSNIVFWPLYLAAAIAAAVAVGFAFRDVVVARRYLAGDPVDPRSGPLPDRNRGTRSGRSAGS